MENVLYLCDRKQCGDKCSYPMCKYTTNIEHAVNFTNKTHTTSDEVFPFYIEKDKEEESDE